MTPNLGQLPNNLSPTHLLSLLPAPLAPALSLLPTVPPPPSCHLPSLWQALAKGPVQPSSNGGGGSSSGPALLEPEQR